MAPLLTMGRLSPAFATPWLTMSTSGTKPAPGVHYWPCDDVTAITSAVHDPGGVRRAPSQAAEVGGGDGARARRPEESELQGARCPPTAAPVAATAVVAGAATAVAAGAATAVAAGAATAVAAGAATAGAARDGIVKAWHRWDGWHRCHRRRKFGPAGVAAALPTRTGRAYLTNSAVWFMWSCYLIPPLGSIALSWGCSCTKEPQYHRSKILN